MKFVGLKNVLKICTLFLLFMLSCASVNTRHYHLLQREISELKSRVSGLQEDAGELSMRQSFMETRIAFLDEQVGGVEQAGDPRSAKERGESEEKESDDPGPRPEPDEKLIEELDTLPAALVYKKGYDYVILADYFRAVTVFTYFIDIYPEHELSDNAHYWTGECYYALKDYPNAYTEFKATVELEGNKTPDALLKMGYTEIAAGETEKGMETLNRVINRFPGTWVAKLAKKKIKKIKESQILIEESVTPQPEQEEH